MWVWLQRDAMSDCRSNHHNDNNNNDHHDNNDHNDNNDQHDNNDNNHNNHNHNNHMPAWVWRRELWYKAGMLCESV